MLDFNAAKILLAGVGGATRLVSAHSNLNVLRGTFQIVVELAASHLAGADPRDQPGLSGMVHAVQESIAAGMGGIADGDGARVAFGAYVIGAAVNRATGNQRHFKGDFVHAWISFQDFIE
jgi:hypothetical protein